MKQQTEFLFLYHLGRFNTTRVYTPYISCFADDTAEFIHPKSQPLIRSVMARSEFVLLFSGALIYSIRSVGSALPDGHERDLRIINTSQSLASSGILFEDFGKTGATGCVQRHQHVSISSYVNSGFHTLPSTLPCVCVCVSIFGICTWLSVWKPWDLRLKPEIKFKDKIHPQVLK